MLAFGYGVVCGALALAVSTSYAASVVAARAAAAAAGPGSAGWAMDSAARAAAFAVVLRWWYRLVGGRRGIERAVGDGASSVRVPELRAPAPEKRAGTVRVVAMSDTHNHHRDVRLPRGDVLVHAGDFTMHGTRREIELFLAWLEEQDFAHKVVVPGNHDLGAGALDAELDARFRRACTLLNDEQCEVAGLKVYGSGRTPWISPRTAMHLQHAPGELEPYWSKIPAGLDVLITHGPPLHHNDRVFLGKHVGCPHLLRRILQVRPKFAVCGHIHEGYGVDRDEAAGVTFINASVCNLLYRPEHAPVVFDVVVG